MGVKEKLADLEAAKSKLKVSCNSTSEISKLATKLADTFEDYIRNDNLASSIIKAKLTLNIEKHSDFEAALWHLNRSILAAEEEVRQEEEAERQCQKELTQKLLGGM